MYSYHCQRSHHLLQTAFRVGNH